MFIKDRSNLYASLGDYHVYFEQVRNSTPEQHSLNMRLLASWVKEGSVRCS
jgi:hypothetical protein